ncbi:class I adenylate-forming enzyme family protein [Prauserella muralis]|uniref:class I adenylate-forming enzyme family protein n=1 Tax=Prauserella muralis TaxID=588067 RepID=UPI001FE3D61C|nr:AMP-binding protein [Prauserella muralis]
MPKGVMLSHHYSYFGAYSFALPFSRGLRFESGLVLGTFLPIVYHIGDQLMLSTFLTGGTMVLGRRPDAQQIAEAITRESVTALWAGSPAMVDVLSANPVRYDPRSLRVLVYGWAALPPGTVAQLKRLCGEELQPMEILGQTEAIACHRFWVDQWRDTFLRTAPEQNYVGLSSPVLAAKIVDEQGHDLTDKPGTPGEVVYRSPVVTAGYYRNEAATKEAFRDGWFHSRDSCRDDADGLRVMLDRYKDIVKTGGENVSSLRVESVLHQHPAVAKAAVVGLPHERWGEAVTAFVVPTDGQTVTEEEVTEFCRSRLAGFETPKRIVVTDALPETVGGKVLKYKIRAEHQTLYHG